MKKFHRSEIFIAWLCLLFIVAFYAVSFISLAIVRPDIDFNSTPVENWSQAWDIINTVFLRYFPNTFIQASLSASAILILGYSMAKSMVYLPPRFKKILLTITNSSFSLPTILVIFALINVLGTSGWVNSLLSYFGISWRVTVFGLFGIIIANAYFNIGYTASAIFNNLQKIPLEHIMLARQCKLEGLRYFRNVELPYLKTNILNLWLLMFMLCFNSFALLLFLGGGPKYANFEVGIYNSLVQDLNFSKALVIAGTQIVFSLILITIISLVTPDHTQSNNVGIQEYSMNNYIQAKTNYQGFKTWMSKIYASLLIIYIGLPLISLAISGVKSGILLTYNYLTISKEQLGLSKNVTLTGDMFTYSWSELGRASAFSFVFATGTAIVCLLISIAILRGFRWLGSRSQTILNNMSLLGLAIPNMLLGAGYYILFNVGLDFEVGTSALVVLIILATSFSSIAYSLNFLAPAYKQVHSYSNLAQSIGLSSWESFKLYEFKLLKNSLVYAFVNIFVLALGDFSIILFFVNNSLTSLTYLLAQQLGGFASNQGNVTALVLLLIIIIIRYFAYSKLSNRKEEYTMAVNH